MPEAPFLPPDQPADNPRPKSQARRTLLVWILLILVFFAIYQLVGGGSGDGGEPSAWSQTLLSLLGHGWPFLLVVVAFVVLFWQLRGGATLNRELEPGQVALHEGRPDEAVRVFREVAAKRRGQAIYAALARYSLASALVRQGSLDEARGELVKAERTPGLPYLADVRLLAAASLAEVAALKGELEVAARWLEEGRKRLAGASVRTGAAAEIRLVETILLCRRAEVERARELLERDWLALEGTLSVQQMRKVWLLRAMLEAQVAEPRDQSGVEEWLDKLRPFRSGEFAFMAGEWPALATFLASYGLS